MATQFFASVQVEPGNFIDVDHSGTSGTATDSFEFRMGNGTYTPNRMECIRALERIKRWLVQGGLNSAGASLPLPPTATEP